MAPKLTPKLTIGPILFHWPEEQKRDFYFRIADEAPVDTVYLGEVICSKRTPFFEKHYEEMAERLKKAGKKVVYSTLSEVMIARDRKIMKGFCEMEELGEEIEVNDASALWHISELPHRIGPFFNAYNEETLAFLTEKGATHFCLPPELPAESVKVMGEKAKFLNVGLEVQVFGRMPLALSARCYHARAHGRVKDNCQFICEEDPDGMVLKTLEKQDFLTVNGIQTLSHSYMNLIGELGALAEMGLTHFRLSPHTNDMVQTARLFDQVLKEKISSEEAEVLIKETGIGAPFSNGFFYRKPGYQWIKEV